METTSKGERPTAGIIVSLILGSINIIWALIDLHKIVNMNFSQMDIMISTLIPHFILSNLVAMIMLLILNTTIIIGSLLSYANHKNGNRVVKVVCVVGIVYVILYTIIDYYLIINSNNWMNAPAEMKIGITSGLIGGLIGGLFEYVLILFLFRKYS